MWATSNESAAGLLYGNPGSDLPVSILPCPFGINILFATPANTARWCKVRIPCSILIFLLSLDCFSWIECLFHDIPVSLPDALMFLR